MNSEATSSLQRLEKGEITVARVVKTQGRRGEVAAEVLTNFPERLEKTERARLVKSGELGTWRTIENVWFHKRLVILKFSGIETITEAEALVGSEVRLPRSEAVPLPGNHHYIFELVGCQLIDDRSGERIGCVKEIIEASGNNVLAAETSQGELLIPFAEEICCTIDTHRREIRVRLPEGLREVNR